MPKPRQAIAAKKRQREGETAAAPICPYSEEQIEAVLEGLAAGQPLRQICRKEGMPSPWAVLRYVEKDQQFAQRYAHARSLGLEVIADEIMEISDDGRNDWIEREEGGMDANHEHINRSKLRVDSRKWLLSKMRPDKYGDASKLTVDGTGPGGSIVIAAAKLEALSDDELQVAFQLQKKIAGDA